MIRFVGSSCRLFFSGLFVYSFVSFFVFGYRGVGVEVESFL